MSAIVAYDARTVRIQDSTVKDESRPSKYWVPIIGGLLVIAGIGFTRLKLKKNKK